MYARKVGIKKDFADKREEDNYTIKLREQERDQKREHRRSVLWQDMMKEGEATTMRVCSRRDFIYACEVLFSEDNRGVGLEIRTNLSDLRAFV